MTAIPATSPAAQLEHRILTVSVQATAPGNLDAMLQVSQVPAARVRDLTLKSYMQSAEAAARTISARRNLATVVSGLKFAR